MKLSPSELNICAQIMCNMQIGIVWFLKLFNPLNYIVGNTYTPGLLKNNYDR